MTNKEKIQYWNAKILDLKNKLYVDGKIERVRDFYGDYEVFTYNKNLSNKNIELLKNKLREAYNQRNWAIDKEKKWIV